MQNEEKLSFACSTCCEAILSTNFYTQVYFKNLNIDENDNEKRDKDSEKNIFKGLIFLCVCSNCCLDAFYTHKCVICSKISNKNDALISKLCINQTSQMIYLKEVNEVNETKDNSNILTLKQIMICCCSENCKNEAKKLAIQPILYISPTELISKSYCFPKTSEKNNCFYCQKEVTPTVPCKICNKTIYCSRKCKKQDTNHQKVCKQIQPLQRRCPSGHLHMDG